MICVICGGVGAARFLLALRQVVDPSEVVAVVNTGDDTVLHGLAISPDIDTVTYTLGGAIDAERGWGLSGETWTAMAGLERYARVRPPGSAAAPTWFNLGDRDLATHFYRTSRLGEGAGLGQVTNEIASAWNVPERLIPMSDSRVATMVELEGGSTVSFQEYFVKLRHDVPVRSITFAGAADAALHPDAARAIADADTVVIAPSNPIVSIGPIRALAGVDELLAARRSSVVAVSPIVGGAALKGPAARMLTELGHESSVVGVALLYRDIAASLVIDPVDSTLADSVRATGMEPIVVPSVMVSPEVGAALARAVLAASA
ncbi:MAG: 2-phospho-L-lactate transferase [Actinomycetota bacterium]|jgi:LPPG:FO 2-phospho-L-lactate transferase